MSFRTRLQSFAETRQKIQVWYGMGCHNTVTGRVLGVDHDHVDIEAYSHESDGQIHVRRILVPMHLILHIDITSCDAEEGIEEKLPVFERKSETLKAAPHIVPEGPRGYNVRIWSQFDSSYIDKFSRLTTGPGGIYLAANNGIWSIDSAGQISEYLQIRNGEFISGLSFSASGVLYAAATGGIVYRIDGSKKGRILIQLNGQLTGGGTSLGDVALGLNETVFVSNFPSDIEANSGGIFRINRNGDYEVLVGGAGRGTQGLLVDQDGFLWALEHACGCVVKRTTDGNELARVVISDPDSFLAAEGYDGNLAMDSLGRIYITAGRAGSVFRLNRDGRTETFLSNLKHPTGITFGADGTLFVLEAGRSRVLRVAALDKADRTTSTPALS